MKREKKRKGGKEKKKDRTKRYAYHGPGTLLESSCQPYKQGRYCPHLHMKAPRFRIITYLAQADRTSKWWD